jgi:peptidoglycan/LPS O-acetylase OafA/YrhL
MSRLAAANAAAPGALIRPLTALRFIAAMWVVLYHYWPNLDGAHTPPLVAKGYLGVELFFILSGFILCHVYLASVAEGRFSYAGFLQARLARIYPLHLATLAAVGAMALAATAAGKAVDPHVLSWPSLLANLLLVHAWGLAPDAGWNHPSWSISAEWFAYLSFPAFAWAAIRLADRPRAAVLGAAGLLASLYAVFPVLAGFPLTEATIDWGALRIVPCFAYGCALYLIWRKGAAAGRTAGLGAAFFGAVLLVAGALAAPDTVMVLIFGGLILTLASLKPAPSSAMFGSVGVYLGEISYSIYMICIPWKLLFVNLWAEMSGSNKVHMPPLVWIIFLATVVPLAALSHHAIERPARSLLRRSFSPRGRPWVTLRKSNAGK